MNHRSYDFCVDLVVLSRNDSPLHPNVQGGIDAQANIRFIVHRVIGTRLTNESSRLSAIVRARNEGKRRGNCQWLMFLDDDVVLAPDTIRRLLDGLLARPAFAALGADYLNESKGRMLCDHVAMGAVLFRRAALDQIVFRWSPGQCECLCCCRDLRRKRWKIGYLPGVRARHISLGQSHRHTASKRDAAQVSELALGAGGERRAYVLAAFDRRHWRKFQHRFLSSLRAAGNQEPVLAFAYGLYPSEQRQLARLPGVRVIPIATNGVAVPIRRLHDFQGPLQRLPADTTVAYWDAGDVIFQDRLTELWRLVSDNPSRLLVVEEPWRHPQNEAIAKWTMTIHDPSARKYAFELLAPRPYFNGGFAAATVGPMLRYLQGAHELLHSAALRGTLDWGDQTAMNLYCHMDPSRFLAIDDRWNYCICGRPPKDRQLLSRGRFVRQDGRPISVIHGNGAALVRYAYSAPAALARSSGTGRFLI